MSDPAGAVRTTLGDEFPVLGSLDTPSFLAFLEPLTIVPRSNDAGAVISVLVVVVTRPDLVEPVAAAVGDVLDADDPRSVTIETSADLAALRALIEGQLAGFGRGLVLVVFGITAVLVAAMLYGLVMLRRKDFGRRRAIGATRGLIVGLLLAQTAMLSLFGAAVGAVASAAALAAAADPLPSFDFFAAVCILAVAVGTLAAVVPAVAASRRDPIRELRVP